MLTPLLSDLSLIKDKAKGLYERETAEGCAGGEGEIVDVSGFAEDLQDVLLGYRVSIQKVDTTVGSLRL